MAPTSINKPGRGIHPLGAYVAKRCAVRLQWDVNHPCEPEEDTSASLRAERGNDFEEAIIKAAMAPEPEGWVVIERSRNESRERRAEVVAETHAAMEDGALVIFDGRLMDVEGLRVGEPDVLVRHGNTPVADTWRYLPLDIKHHSTLTAWRQDEDPALLRPAVTSPLSSPFLDSRSKQLGFSRKRNENDAIQLAHYARMLDACDHMASDWWGGIIGSEGVVLWYDLHENLKKTRSTSNPDVKQKWRSALERYDHEFDFRIKVMRAADAATKPEDFLVEPLHCSECKDCPWREHCGPIINAQGGNVTLLPRVSYAEWLKWREHGITTREDLAKKVGPAAHLFEVFAPDSLEKVLEKARGEDNSEVPIGALLRANATKQHQACIRAGVVTAQDLVDLLDQKEILPKSSQWSKHVTRAQAATGDKDFIAWPDAELEGPPRFDIEVDIDMENSIDDFVYLWGALVTDRSTGDSKYFAFADWNCQSHTDEVRLFEEFWGWFYALRTQALVTGRTFGAYCWHKGAEEGRLRALSAHDLTLTQQVNEFAESDSWIDLLHSWRDNYTNGRGDGLKLVAEHAGFSWRVDEPSGEDSMQYYEDQLTSDEQSVIEENQAWLLSYNEDDCRATQVIRDWLEALVGSDTNDGA